MYIYLYKKEISNKHPELKCFFQKDKYTNRILESF